MSSEVELTEVVNIPTTISACKEVVNFKYERFPFVLPLPDWLPSSLVLTNDRRDTEIMVEYMLVAEYIPVDKVYFIQTEYTPPPSRYDLKQQSNWNTCKVQLSRVNTIRFIHILQPRKEIQAQPIPAPLVSKVGGFLGMF